jgi:2-oxoglutarate ferredoxin oxidoreductase subunit gamma
MDNKILVAGFGGQGVMVIGQMLGYAACMSGRNAVFLPKYGPEQRGGTASCNVTLSDKEIGAPIAREVDVLIALNQQSLDKFIGALKKNGTLIINSSLCKKPSDREDIEVCEIPANDIAEELGNAKVSNVVIIGAYIKKTGMVTEEEMLSAIKAKLGKKAELLEMNKLAMKRAIEAAS